MWFLLFFSQKLCIIYFPSDSSSFVLSAESFSFDLKMNFRAPITSYIPCFFHVLIYPSTWKKPRFEIRFHERFNSAPRNGLCPWNDEKVDGSNVIVSRLLAFVLEYVRKVWKYATEKSRRLLLPHSKKYYTIHWKRCLLLLFHCPKNFGFAHETRS